MRVARSDQTHGPPAWQDYPAATRPSCHDDIRLDEAAEVTEAGVLRGEVDIWQYAARVTLALQDSIDNAEGAVLHHNTLILAGYMNDIPAEQVAAQLDWFI